MAIIEIKSVEDFNTKVLGCEGVGIVDYWAEWCTPCMVMRPEVEEVAEKLADKATFFSVNAENKTLRKILLTQEVEGIPSMVFYRDGKQLDRIAGYKKAEILESLINEVINQA